MTEQSKKPQKEKGEKEEEKKIPRFSEEKRKELYEHLKKHPISIHNFGSSIKR